jgi:hypothetical protein
MRTDLRRYAGFRLAVVSADAGEADRLRASAESSAVAQEMRRLTVDAAHRNPSSTDVGLVVQALDDLAGVSAEEDAILATYVPKSVMFMLVVIASIATALMGFRFGRLGERGLISSTSLAIAIAIAIGIVLDLGAPQRGGFVSVSSAPLKAAQASISR